MEKGSALGLANFSEEAVKKLAACASAHMDECLVEALERGSLDVMGNLRFR